MNRRNFLKRFSLTVGAVTLIPQVVVKSITERQNPVKVFKSLNYERINTVVRDHYIPFLQNQMMQESALFQYLSEDKSEINDGEKITMPLIYGDKGMGE
jgi:hypothetical protein